MRLHTVTAESMKDAIALVREAFGPDAVIVSTHAPKGGGIAVTVAAETPAGPAAPEAESEPGGLEPEFDTAAAPMEAGLAPAEAGTVPPRRAPRSSGRTVGWEGRTVSEALAYHGVPEPLAGALARLAEGLEAEEAVYALAAALESRFAFGPLPAQPVKPLMLVGPSGVGKTVTAAKIASRFVLADHPVELVTTDTGRAGGVEQLGHFARLLDCPLVAIKEPEELSAHLDGAEDGVIRIVDTPGANPFDGAELRDLRRFTRAAPFDVALVIAAGGEPRDAAEIADAFARIGARRLIATRLDAVRRLGGLLAAADSGDLAFACAGITPYIARGLSSIDATALARLLLDDPAERPSLDALHEAAE